MKPLNSSVSIDHLLAHLPENYTEADRELALRAYQTAEEAHRGQKRHSGEPYMNHCVAVASILSDLKVPPEALVAGLLHDTVEDTTITLEDIGRDFGETVKDLVDGVTKLTHLPRLSRGDQHAESGAVEQEEKLNAPALLGRKENLVAETLRKTFVAMSKDVRVMFIKLADRLHNMRTLDHMPEHKRLRIAQETLDIFAPVASRLGIWQMKWELEDLSFFYVNPDKYKEIEDLLADDRAAREAKLEAIKKNILAALKKHHIQAEISGRPKHIYSIYRKMQNKDKSFDMLRDLRAVRLIVPTEQDCYITLGVIHAAWKPIPKEFDDYIAAPKENNYKSLHTAVFYEDNPLEVQIRTHEMHLNSEYGVAAHWRYKEGGKRADENHGLFLNTLRSMVEWSSDVHDATEFVESMRNEVFQERVYAFTPRGDAIDLPGGATPIDFAYHVHTDVGHRCGGARVNGKLVSLDHKLKTGDRVEILTSKRGGPSRDWLNPNLGLVCTQRARSKITLWFKKLEDATNIAQGRAALENEFHKLGLSENVNFEKTARNLNFKTPDEMFLALGNGDLSLNKIIKRVVPKEETEAEEFFKINPSSKATSEIVGLKNMLSIMAQCCNPMPGNQIIGYVTRGRGVTVHRKDCPNVKKIKDSERLLQIRWGYKENAYPVPIKIQALDRPGLVSEITGLLSADSINISNAYVHTDKTEADVKLTIDVKDISQLSRILSRIGAIPGVTEVHRVKPG